MCVFAVNVLILSNYIIVGLRKALPNEVFRREIYDENPDIDGKAFIGASLIVRSLL